MILAICQISPSQQGNPIFKLEALGELKVSKFL